jgi:dihydrofolate reductase
VPHGHRYPVPRRWVDRPDAPLWARTDVGPAIRCEGYLWQLSEGRHRPSSLNRLVRNVKTCSLPTAMSSGVCHRLYGMRIVISEFISLDGVVQAPGGPDEDRDGGFQHGGWSMPFFDPEVMGSSIDEASKRTDALLYGRRTWQVMAGAWPERAGDPFADWINAVEKHVVSNTLSEADLTWRPTTLIRGADLPTAVTALRERPGRDVNVLGSAQLVRTLLEADLVDEMNLMIEPIVLGGGKTIFPRDGAARRFELVSATTAGTGVQVCRYERTR